MHGAPSVSYPVGRAPLAAVLLLAAWLCGAAAATAWWWQQGSGFFGWRLSAMLLALSLAGTVAATSWWRAPSGTLAWDGECWTWMSRSGTETGCVRVALDLQRSLLLHWSAPGASRWLWLVRASHAERWDDLRRAVYSRARPQALQQAEPPAAKP